LNPIRQAVREAFKNSVTGEGWELPDDSDVPRPDDMVHQFHALDAAARNDAVGTCGNSSFEACEQELARHQWRGIKINIRPWWAVCLPAV
jgi:hypothetical protein